MCVCLIYIYISVYAVISLLNELISTLIWSLSP